MLLFYFCWFFDGLLMSLVVGVELSNKIMGFDENSNEQVSQTKALARSPPAAAEAEEHPLAESKSVGMSRQMSESSIYATDQEEEDDEERKIELGPQYTLKEQLEKDKVGLFVLVNMLSVLFH